MSDSSRIKWYHIVILLSILITICALIRLPGNRIVKSESAPRGQASGLTRSLAFGSSSKQNFAKLGNYTFKYELADTPELREQGLSDRSSLATDTAMLFIFPAPSKLAFWMKDMHFNLDMIWLDANKKVIDITYDATPESYAYYVTFSPNTPAQFVLEVNAGIVNKYSIKIGDTLILSN